MTIAVVGLGSMGKRRIRILQDMYSDTTIIGADNREDRRAEVESLFSIECKKNFDDIEKSLDCAFVCTSPLSHNEIIKRALLRGCHVFSEINLVSDGYDENIGIANDKDRVLFLSSTFLFREEMQYIKRDITDDRLWNYSYHVGQYLPEWHPWEKYADSFLGNSKTNGCREILAIELPWLIDVFGDIIDIKVMSDKMTGLQIDYSDNYMLQIKHKNGNKGSLIVDVVSPVAVRNLEIYAEGKYYSWQGTPDSLCRYDRNTSKMERVKLKENAEHIEGYQNFIVENAYRKEIEEFFDVIFNNKVPRYGFKEDKKIIELIDSIGA